MATLTNAEPKLGKDSATSNKHFIERKNNGNEMHKIFKTYHSHDGGNGQQRICSRGGATKKGPKVGSADAPKASIISKEVKATTVVGANLLEDGTDPKILPDSEYPDWLWHLLDKRPPLSEFQRKNMATLPYEDLKRLVKQESKRTMCSRPRTDDIFHTFRDCSYCFEAI